RVLSRSDPSRAFVHIEGGRFEERADHAASLLAVEQAERLGALLEAAALDVHERPARVVAMLAPRVLAHPTVRVIDVEVAVVLEVDEAGAPAPTAVRNARKQRDVRELAVAVVAIKTIAYRVHGAERHGSVRREDARDEPVEIAVVVVIAERGTHAVV